jgi:hypothetical protein
MPVGIDEGQNFRNRRIRVRMMSRLVQTLGEDPGAVEQLLIKRLDHREAFAGEFAAFHTDDVEADEASGLAGCEAKRDHIATRTACRFDHRLRPDANELVSRR